MSYHLTIVRTDGKMPETISEAEVHSMVEEDGALSFENRGDYLNIKKTFRDQEFYFIYKDGEVWIKNPSPEHIALLIELAKRLGGRVRGDEYETYVSPTETIIHPDDKQLVIEAKEASVDMRARHKRRGLIMNGSIFLFFIMLGLLANFLSK